MTCVKVRFNDKQQAIDAIHLIKEMPNEGDKPTRAYYCTLCNGWHITKTNLADNAKQIRTKHYNEWKSLM